MASNRFPFAAKQRSQGGHRCSHELRAPAVSSFARLVWRKRGASRSVPRPRHADDVVVQVDVRPAQLAQLAPPDAGVDRRRPQRPVAIWQRVDQIAGLGRVGNPFAAHPLSGLTLTSLLALRLPRGLNDVAVRVSALDADVLRLIPLLDELDAVCGEAVAQAEDGGTVGQTNAEVHPGGANDRLLVGTERECKAARIVEHQDVIVVTPRRTRVEAKIGLIEATGALLIPDRDR